MATRPTPTFNYVQGTAADFNDIMARAPSGFDSPIEGARSFFPKNGEHFIRILPWSDHKHWAMGTNLTPPLVWQHNFVGTRGGTYLCINRMKNNLRCPICEEARAMQRRDPEAAKKIAAKSRLYLYVLDRKAANPEEPLVWSIWHQLHNSIMATTKSLRGNVIFPANPKEGYDMGFIKTVPGPGMANYDSIRFDTEPSPILDDPDRQKKLLQWLAEHPLDSLLSFKTPQYLEEIMSGTGAEPDAELDAEEAGEDTVEVEAAPQPRRPARAAAAPMPEDSPLPNGDEDEDEDEELDEDPEADEPEDADEEADEQVAPAAPPPRDPELRARRREPEAPRRTEPERSDRRRPSGNGNVDRDAPPMRTAPAPRPQRPPERGSRYNRD
jgi:hypothetical protein